MCFSNDVFALLPVLRYFCYKESAMSFISSKKKLSDKSVAHLKGGIHEVSEFSLTDIRKGKIDVQFVNVDSKLLILLVYNSGEFYGHETLNVYELQYDGAVVTRNIMPPFIIEFRQLSHCRYFPPLAGVNHSHDFYGENKSVTFQMLNLLSMDLGFADYLFDFDCKCILIDVLGSFNYIVASTRKPGKMNTPSFFLILEILEKIDKQKHELIEVHRLNLTKRVAVNGHVNIKNVIFNANKNKVLFHAITDQVITDKESHNVKIYDPNKQDFIESTFLYNERCKVIISYVNHNEHQDRIIICFYPGKNETSTFLGTKIVGFNLFRKI